MSIRRLSALLPFALAAAASGSAQAEVPPPAEVNLEPRSMSYSGTGCPAGSATIVFAADRSVFTVLYSVFTAEVGEGIAAEEARKDCKLHFKLKTPKGWSYSIENVDFRGFAFLDEGVSASLESSYHLSGEGPMRTDAVEFLGPYADDYSHRDAFPDAMLSSRCGGGKNVQITTRLRMSSTGAPAAPGMLTVDSVDGTFSQTYRLSWKRCNR
jgi:hypothetical protein